MFGDISKKLQEAQQKAEEVKERLSSIVVKGSAGGKVEVFMTANRELRDVQIKIELDSCSKEELEDLISLSMKDALRQANEINEAEMGALARDAMPSIPGLGNMFKK